MPNDGSWPDSYDDAHLFGDFICHKIFTLTPDGGGGYHQSTFATDLGGGGPISMAFNPYESATSLYCTTFANGGEVRRITYTGGLRRVADGEVCRSSRSLVVSLQSG